MHDATQCRAFWAEQDQTKGFLYNHMVKNNPILPLQQLLNVCALLQNVGKVITTREQWQTASSKGIFPSEFSCGLSIDQTTGIQRWIGWTGGTLKKDPGLDEGWRYTFGSAISISHFPHTASYNVILLVRSALTVIWRSWGNKLSVTE